MSKEQSPVSGREALRPGHVYCPLPPSSQLSAETDRTGVELESEEEDSSAASGSDQELETLLSVLTSSSMEALCPSDHPPPLSSQPSAAPLSLTSAGEQPSLSNLTQHFKGMQLTPLSKPPVLCPAGELVTTSSLSRNTTKDEGHKGRILRSMTPRPVGHPWSTCIDNSEDDKKFGFLMDSTPLPGAVVTESSVVPRTRSTICRRLILDMETQQKCPSATSRVKSALKLGTGHNASQMTVIERPQTAATMEGVEEDGYEHLYSPDSYLYDLEENADIDISQGISSFPSFNPGILDQYQKDLGETTLPRHKPQKVDWIAQQGMARWEAKYASKNS